MLSPSRSSLLRFSSLVRRLGLETCVRIPVCGHVIVFGVRGDTVDEIIGDLELALAGVGAGGLAAECACVDVEAGEPECGGDVLHVGRRERRFISEPYVPVVVSHTALFVELGICYSASFNEISTYVDDSLAVFGDFISGNASHAQHGTQLRRICKEYLIE